MSNLSLANRLIDTLPSGLAGLFNPWRDNCPHDAKGNGPAAKRDRLALHLDSEPRFILVGEAPGYAGCRYSGIPFTSERLLGKGIIPRLMASSARLSTRRLPFSEPSATIVWNALYRLGIAEQTLLWNALQLHPHRLNDLWSNRTPTAAELQLGEPAIRLLVAEFPAARIIAVGKHSERLLQGMGMTIAGSIRHPANGGATQFFTGLSALL